MDHSTFEERQVLERYVMGQLPSEEAARLEEHFLSCPECLEQLELTEAMARGFRRAAAQDAERLAAARQLALVAWLSRLSRGRQAGLLAAAFVALVVLPGALGLRQIGARGRELAQARSELAAAGERAAAEAGALRGELAAERQARAQAEAELAAARGPVANVPILFLDAERGGPAEAEPTFRLLLPEAPGWVVIAVALESARAQSYRLALRDAHGRVVWQGDSLAPGALGSLTVSLPTSMLAPGDYTLEAQSTGARAPASRFRFRALPPG